MYFLYFLLQMGIFQQSLCDRLPEGISFAPNLFLGGRSWGYSPSRRSDEGSKPLPRVLLLGSFISGAACHSECRNVGIEGDLKTGECGLHESVGYLFFAGGRGRCENCLVACYFFCLN